MIYRGDNGREVSEEIVQKFLEILHKPYEPIDPDIQKLLENFSKNSNKEE